MAMIAQAIERAGGVSALARAVGVDHSTVIGWRRAGRVPVERVKAVCAATGISPHELRPDIFDAPAAQQGEAA
jgi:DNA-binding transcriptional regulator YdaS (Cro superfamily)